MNAAISTTTPGSQSDIDIIGEYADRIQAPLIGIVPFERRQRFASEVTGHLEALAEDYRMEGLPFEEAAMRAIREHGNPGKLSNDFVAAYYEQGARGPIERKLGRANCTAFGIFLTIQGLYLLFLQVRIFEPNGAYYRLPLSPGQVRQLWPAPLPYPEASPWFAILLGYPLIAPFLAGWWIGRQIPARAGSAVYHALLPLIVCSFVVGVFLLPVTEGILFALVQLVLWLPAGSLTAHLASLSARAARIAKAPEGR